MTNENQNNPDNQNEHLNDKLKKFSESYGADAMGGDLGLKGIRQSPAWYLTSDTVEGAEQARTELLQNAVDESAEVSKFFMDEGVKVEDIPEFIISMKIDSDDTFYISDTGRGVPADYHEKFGRPTLEVAFEELNIGAKGKGFVQQGKSAYKSKTIGKHGSGAACANATSDFFEVISYVLKDDKVFGARWETAEKVQPTKEIGPANGKHGTHIRFRPSRDVFRMYNGKGEKQERFYSEENFVSILKEYAFNTDNIVFKLEFQQPDGSYSLAEIKSKDYDPTKRLEEKVQGDVYMTQIVNEEDDYELKVYAGFSPSSQEIITTSNMLTLSKGTHTDLFREVFNEVLFDVEKEINHRLSQKKYTQRVTARGLEKYGVYSPSGYISIYGVIKMGNPQYTSQAKEELRVPHIIESLRASLTETINTDFKGLKDKVVTYLADRGFTNIEANIHHDKVKEAQKKREENKKELEEMLNLKDPTYTRGMGKGDKNVYYARTQDATKTIVHFVEGETASDALRAVRDTNFHTIVNLDQRPPNVYNHKLEKLKKMERYALLYRMLYGSKNGNLKAVVIATDNDPDGDLIRSYLLAFIYMFFPHYLTQGRVFILETPKYAAVSAQNEVQDFNTYEERKLFLDTERQRTADGLQEDKGWIPQQYKGLGSIPEGVLSNLVKTGQGYVRINPDTIEDGMIIIEQMLNDKVFKKHYVMENYSTEQLRDHTYARQEIVRRQEIDFDIHHLDVQFNTTPDLSSIQSETSLEKIIREKSDSISEESSEKDIPYLDIELFDDDGGDEPDTLI